MLEVKELYCGYDGIDIIKNFNLTFERGKNIAIVGPNGCGKSTFLKAIANLLDYRGNVVLQGKDLKLIGRKELARKVALMSQSSDVFFPYTVFETVALGRYAHLSGIFSELSNNDKETVLKCIENVGLLDYKDKLINELSGGQLQRVYLARVFAQDPDIILLDEPTNHLDLKCQIEILEQINKWVKENNKTVIGVIHDLNLVQMFSEETIVIKNGELVARGKTKEVLNEKLLRDVYETNVKQWMIEALEKWK